MVIASTSIGRVVGVTCVFLMRMHFSDSKIMDCNGTEPVEVTINDGKLTGTTLFGEKYRFCAFMGIPFAEPPIRHLRFRPPQPVKQWRGVLNATKEPARCMQIGFTDASEDCLYINVYTPKLPLSDRNLMTVIVFIYGGEFYFGSCKISVYNPAYFIERGVVFVTFNYRLGAFGFLSTEDDEAPGNYGMKDQVLALKWVQQNIHHFGGDPDKVTIFGHSAGAASVHHHMMSPLTKGLFRNAISNEGTVFMPWARNNNPKQTAEKQAHLVGCPTQPSSKMISCLRELPAKTIDRTIFALNKFLHLPSPGYTPVAEKATDKNPEPYLTHDPLELVKNGSFQRVPWLMGSNSHTLGSFIAPLFNIDVVHDQLAEQSIEFWRNLILTGVPNGNEKISIYEEIKKFYGMSQFTPHMTTEQQIILVTMLSDYYIIHGVHKAAFVHSALGHKPIYKYNMAFKGHFSTTMLTSLINYGTSHGDELLYLFKDVHNLKLPFTDNEKEVRDLLVSLWTNFAKYGNPTPQNLSEPDVSGLVKELKWEPIGNIDKNNKHMQYLNIGQADTNYRPYSILQYVAPVKINMAVDLYKERMDFWDSLPLEVNIPCPVCKKVESKANSVKFHSTFVTIFLLTIVLYY